VLKLLRGTHLRKTAHLLKITLVFVYCVKCKHSLLFCQVIVLEWVRFMRGSARADPADLQQCQSLWTHSTLLLFLDSFCLLQQRRLHDNDTPFPLGTFARSIGSSLNNHKPFHLTLRMPSRKLCKEEHLKEVIVSG
jgi:hypothetical protein